MTKTVWILASFLLPFSSIFGQAGKDLNINFMLRGHVYAQSSVVDSLAPGGFGGSDNLPQKIDARSNFSENGFFLKIDTTALVSISGKYNGYNLFIINKSDSIVQLEVSDSRLYAIAEIYYKEKWQPIEYLPHSWCGNSYYNVYLKQNEYWSFPIPKFSGKIKTKLRYRLMIGKDKYVYSNIISAGINKGQLTRKEEHVPNGIMDPYND